MTTGNRPYRIILSLLFAPLLLATPLPLAPHGTPRAAAVPVAPVAALPAVFLPRVNIDLAADDPAYAVTPTAATTLHATNPAQRLAFTFAMDGVTVSGQDAAPWRFALAAVNDQVPAPAIPVIVGGRVEYRHGDLTEWYVNGPVGLEQGFTLAALPVTGDSVTLTLAIDGATPTLTDKEISLALPDGKMLRYAGLVVTDAAGRQLPARFDARGSTVAIILEAAGAAWPVTVDPFFETTPLTANDPASTDNLGYSVAVDSAGDVVVAGAQHKTVGGVASMGAAYVWHLGGSITTTKLTRAVVATAEAFGHSVAVSADGSKVAVGAPLTSYPFTNSGAVFVFSGANYATHVDLFASNAASGDGFGSSVAMTADGTVIAIGAPFKTVTDPITQSPIAGVGEVYLKQGSGYLLENRFAPPSITQFTQANFGSSIAIDALDNTLVAGAPNFAYGGIIGSTDGAVVVFTGAPPHVIIASDHDVPDIFGSSVAVSADGKVIVVGAPDKTGSFASQGAAYIYSGANYATETILHNPTPAASDYFGYSVTTNGNGGTVVIGTFNKNKVFAYSGTNYSAVQTITSSAPNGTHFGDSVAISASGGTLVGSAPSQAVGAVSQAGQVHVFTFQVPQPAPSPQPNGPPGGSPGPRPPIQPNGPINPTKPNPLPTHRP